MKTVSCTCVSCTSVGSLHDALSLSVGSCTSCTLQNTQVRLRASLRATPFPPSNHPSQREPAAASANSRVIQRVPRTSWPPARRTFFPRWRGACDLPSLACLRVQFVLSSSSGVRFVWTLTRLCLFVIVTSEKFILIEPLAEFLSFTFEEM